MEYRPLGRTDIRVSVIGLGTMTFGEQNSEAESHAILDAAVDHGINLLDVAELYPSPMSAGTQGDSERFIGSWLQHRDRSRLVIASKVAGPGRVLGVSWLRDGKTRLDRRNIEAALDGSLKRACAPTTSISTSCTGPTAAPIFLAGWAMSIMTMSSRCPIAETLGVLDELVRAGKIRTAGISNETPWGTSQFLQLASAGGHERIVSIQNPYNLLNRTFEIGLAEIAIREQVGLLAYSPLAFGILSGKYLDGARPANARLTRFPTFRRYSAAGVAQAAAAYVALAREHALDPSQMALAYVNSRRFLTSTIIGVTTLEQLRCNVGSAGLKLSREVLEGIEKIHQRLPNPAP
jgi:aryl-alcohol dehydrogenase-like predicted oxidoreductase